MCGIVFNNRQSGEVMMIHLLINWPSSTAEFYSRRTSYSDKSLSSGHAFPVRLLLHNRNTCGEGDEEIKKGHTTSDENTSFQQRASAISQVPSSSMNSSEPVMESESSSQFGALWNGPPPFNVSWGSVSSQLHAGPTHNGRGTYIYRLSPGGELAALAVNTRKAKDSRILFFSPLTEGGLTSPVYTTPVEGQTGRSV